MAITNAETHRYSREDALRSRQFQLLLEGARELPDSHAQDTRFVILVAGRLGLRAGEIAHIQRDWVDFRRQMIEIPVHEPCQKGMDGGVCGYCRAQSAQAADANDDLSQADAEARMWSPKTVASAREVPFGHNPRATLAIERFFNRHDEWPFSRAVVNRRVTAAAEHAAEVDADHCYPHALRATAATTLADNGLDIIPLKAFMGWSKLETAKHYLSKSGKNTARALERVHAL
ncbi:integrase [Halarchaeum rubridurum]|uniref:Integrase n=1 Tax=Halarchaeum rubridurum TaxID=489911 RepID=A0A830FUN5_9EURY|nr:site-specific integrase [Halarchaeum rubridurum]MBP1953618.1 integrase [Halarchaeum rubridurum]GGM63894.1 hypothetical protein GCM10009017_12460 [Halarchaeum rubridurum]